MARWSHALWRPLPEFDNQPAMRATQHISHVTASTGPISGTWKYFASPDVGVESHFGVDYGAAYGGNNDIWQAIDTSRSADANYKANLRPDGTGAISVETRGGEYGRWTPFQVDVLVSNGAWAHAAHGIPLRICRDPDDPGYGFHTLFGAPSAWTPVAGKTCPGPDRKPQWRDEVFPRIVAVAQGREPDPLEDDMTAEESAKLSALHALLVSGAPDKWVNNLMAAAARIDSNVGQPAGVDAFIDRIATAVAAKLPGSALDLAVVKQGVREVLQEGVLPV